MTDNVNSVLMNNEQDPVLSKSQIVDSKFSLLHQWFESIAVANPQRVAVVDHSGSSTYQEINQRANQLAYHILGTYHNLFNQPICIYLPSSVAYVIAKLAILKTGAAYVPLDIHYPLDRIQNIVSSTATPFVVTDTNFGSQIKGIDAHFINIEETEEYKHYPVDNPNLQMSPDDLAYLIFTSGSTGEPKGVCIRHRNIVNLMYWSHTFYHMQGGENAVQTTRLVFDASVWEYWMNLLAGNTLYIVEQATLLDMDKLFHLLQDQQIIYALLPTPIAEIFMQSDNPLPAHLKELMIGGDRLITRPKIDFGVRVTNLYGPAECTVIATAKVVEPTSDLHRNPSIGQPIDNCTVYILDGNLRRVETGTIGEIYIGGQGVGAGYWKRPDLTDQAFFTDPFSVESTSVMYKTGDLGRFYPDGDIDFIGRTDTQIKIRGFRIELSEIETVLLQHPAIQECVVLPLETGSKDQSIAAYYCLHKGYSVTTDEVIRFAQSKLADYMVPSYMKQLDEMPLTENGKIARKALPALDIQTDREYIAPQSALEIQVSDIWKSILKVDQISMNDQFYSIGGHSLKATQIISRLRSELGVELEISILLNNPTLAECVDYLNSSTKKSREAIPVCDHDAPYPLAWAQHGMWYYWKLDPLRTDYNIPLRIDIHGALDIDRLQATIDIMVERHEVLRTAFLIDNGIPVARVLSAKRCPLNYNRLQEMEISQTLDPLDSFKEVLPYPVDDCRINDIRKEMASIVFDLSKGYLHSWNLVDCGNDDFILFITIHHIITDGWSMGVFIQDLRDIYSSQGLNLPTLQIQYSDYAHWQKQLPPADKYPEQLAFWKQQLIPLPPQIRLQANKTDQMSAKHPGDRVWWKIDAELVRQIRKLASDEGKSLFTFLLTVYKILLAKYSGENDIVVGSSYAGRDAEGTEELMGLFTNLLALRTQMDNDIIFKDLLSRVHKTTISAFANADYPFDQMIKDIGYKTVGNQHPIFNAIFVLQNFPIDLSERDNISMKFIEMGNGTSKFDLLFTVEEWHDDLICWMEYNTEHIDRAIAENLAKHFCELCRLICQDPYLPMDKYDPLSSSEKAMILYDWNSTYLETPKTQNYIDLFREVVSHQPDELAAICNDIDLTYQELDDYSSQLACHLMQKGLAPDSVIGITLSRKHYLPITILAIWKLGCSYLPLDADFPPERIQYMIDDAAVKLLITETEYIGKISPSIEVLVVDQVHYQDSPIQTLPLLNSSANAYIIYTSGSTGKPKGVMISHNNMINHNYAVIKEFDLQTNDRVLQFGSISFDLSVEEMFPTWLAGACVVFRTEQVTDSLEYFLEFISKQAISVIDIPTAYWHELVYVLEYVTLPASVRLCIIGGEKALQDRLILWQKHVSLAVRLLNTYGPTEATIIATVFEPCITATDNKDFPIGRPIANTQIYILNPMLQALPVGVAGELYIGGRGVAQGYVNKPELTAEKFVPNVFTQDNSSMYKTGDLACYDARGYIHYLGRVDNQIKLLGHRIELSEIEHHLSSIAGVKDAVVLLYDDDPSHQYLVAYIVLTTTLEFEDIKQQLSHVVPDYMIPAQIISLPEIPLTTQGKLDKRSLPRPDFKPQARPVCAPKTDTENLIYPIWNQVLGLEQCDTKTSFMDMGGHSLKAMLLVSLLEKSLGKVLSLKSFLDHQTIHALAQYLDNSEDNSIKTKHTAIEEVSRIKDSYPMSFAQEGLWFLWELDDTKISYNIPMCYTIHGYLETDILEHAYQHMLARHEVFHTRFVSTDEKARVVIDLEPDPKIEQIDLSNLPETIGRATARNRAKQIAATKFNLHSGPLYVLKLIKLADNEWNLILVVHHIVADGWSFAVFSKELFELYSDLILGIPIKSEPLRIQSIDYAEWQQSPAILIQIDEQAKYWQTQLSPLPEPLTLPYQNMRPAFQTYTGSQIKFEIDSGRLKNWQDTANKHEASLFMMLLCGLNIMYYNYSQQTEIIIGSPFANRKNPELENIIGCFTNMLPLRVSIDPQAELSSLLKVVKDTCLDAYAHSDYPFHLMPSLINLPRDTSRHPIYQVMLTLQNYQTYDLIIPGLNISTDMIENGSSKMDMSWDIAIDETGLHGVLEFNDILFSPVLCNRMLSNLLQIMDQMTSNHHQKISLLDSIDPPEMNTVLYGFNNTAVALPPYNSVIEWIFARCEVKPGKTAVRFDNSEYSYLSLQWEVSELANILAGLGIGRGDRIGIYLPRCPQMLFACLAAWTVGASFLYLDREFPPERLIFMIDDSDLKLIIADTLVEYIQETHEVLLLDIFTNNPSACKVVALSGLDSEAYTIFTSGSTGKPKGVRIAQRSLINFLASMQKKPGICHQDTLAAITPLSFDISMLEMFLPLVSGGELVILSREAGMDANLLADQFENHSITMFQATPSTYKMLIDSGWQGKSDLKLLCGGEALSSQLAIELRKQCFELWNMYGPTETTIWSCIHPIVNDKVFIGKPIDNTTVYILNQSHRPVPLGAWGELFIGGAGVAMGYLKREDLTKQRFIESAFVKGETIYQTGDIVRWTEQGALEYAGRNDFQVKINGHRIELEEIASKLLQQNSVSDAVVTVRETKSGIKVLVAYIILLNASVIEDYAVLLGKDMPDYMIPKYYIYLPVFPLTANGKIDVKALPEPTWEHALSNQESRKPYTPEQEILCKAVIEILERKTVSIDDNFFDLGGNSILTMRLISTINKSGLSVTVDQIFRHKTLEGLAQNMQIRRTDKNAFGSESLILLQKGKKDSRPLFLVHPLPGDVLGYVNLVKHLSSDITVYGFQALGLSDPEHLHRSIPEMAAYYNAIIKSLNLESFYLGGWCYGGSIAIEMVNQMGSDCKLVPYVFLFDTWAFNPKPDIWLNYLVHRLKVAMFNWRRITHLVRTKLRERQGFQVIFDRENIFQDQGIFSNRSLVRKANLNSLYIWKMGRYKCKIVLFKAMEQHPATLHDWSLGWKVFAPNTVIHDFDTTHDNILKEPSVKDVAAKLETYLIQD